MGTDVLIGSLQSLVKKPPARLLVIGGFSRKFSLEAGQTVSVDSAADRAAEIDSSEPFDLVVWRLDSSFGDDEIESVLPRLEDRGRLLLIVGEIDHRRAVLMLSRLGFAIQKELRVPTGEGYLQILVARQDGYVVRAYQPGDEADILQLFAPAFHAARSADHWRWKFLRNPYGSLRITLARSPEGELAGHYAGYPVKFLHHEGRQRQELSCLQIGDTMTAPSFRSVGRGPTSILGRCVRHFYAAWCEQRVAFNYGFNTGNIQRFSLRFVGAQRLEPVGYWRLDSGAPPLATGRYRTVEIRKTDVQQTQATKIDDSWSRFSQRVARHYGLLVSRDADYLNWRYLDCPDAPRFVVLAAYRWRRLVGWSVFRRRGEQLVWCDALFHPRHASAAADLLRAGLEHSELQGTQEVIAWFPPRPAWWHEQLMTLGFEAQAEPNDLGVMYVPHARSDSGELLTQLYYTLGDSDLA